MPRLAVDWHRLPSLANRAERLGVKQRTRIGLWRAVNPRHRRHPRRASGSRLGQADVDSVALRARLALAAGA